MEHKSAIRASRSTVSPWFNASGETKIKGRGRTESKVGQSRKGS